MSLEEVPGTGLHFHLVVFDADGRERSDADGPRSRAVIDAVATEPISDVFLFSHGWKGDVPAARRQYRDWIRTMAGCTSDIERAGTAWRGAFRPLLIGVHWPSLPFGDEELGARGGSFAVESSATAAGPASPEDPDALVESMIDAYAARIADTPAAREALRLIVTRAIDDVAPDRLPPEVADACAVLDRESGLGSGGEGSEPGSDREAFDPEAVYAAVQEEESVSFGDFGFGGLLALVRTLSFWQMKARARRFGEGGAHDLLIQLIQSAGPDVRFHLMGHSFGCIVASGMAAGPPGRTSPARPVDTLILIQGAFSLWSYCPEIPTAPGRPGYFHPILRDGRVRGPIITTQSEHDLAVGRCYPLAAGVRRQVDYNDQLPTYGAVGTFGLCGLDDRAEFGALRAASETYAFEPGRVYNLESSGIIRHHLNRIGGAHCDILHPEVGHAAWSAVLAGSHPR
jgi:pimeloyl-ACP methyl ester carboxylesterase